jgi:hypothetical protein
MKAELKTPVQIPSIQATIRSIIGFSAIGSLHIRIERPGQKPPYGGNSWYTTASYSAFGQERQPALWREYCEVAEHIVTALELEDCELVIVRTGADGTEQFSFLKNFLYNLQAMSLEVWQ